MKKLILLAIFAALPALAATPAKPTATKLVIKPEAKAPETLPGQIREGGGGIIREGRYLTFGSIRAELSLPITESADLSFLSNVISQMPMSLKYKGQLVKAFLPSTNRKFYNILSLSKAEEANLIAIYRKTLEIPGNVPVPIYAVTDKEKNETYILPTLQKVELQEGRAAILAHEGSWILASNSGVLVNYRDVLEFEVDFQKYLEESKGNYSFNGPVYAKLEKFLNAKEFYLLESIKDDYSKGKLTEFLYEDGSLPIDLFFPELRLNTDTDPDILIGHNFKIQRKFPTLSTPIALTNSTRKLVLKLKREFVQHYTTLPIPLKIPLQWHLKDGTYDTEYLFNYLIYGSQNEITTTFLLQNNGTQEVSLEDRLLKHNLDGLNCIPEKRGIEPWLWQEREKRFMTYKCYLRRDRVKEPQSDWNLIGTSTVQLSIKD